MASLSSDQEFRSALATAESQIRKDKILIRFGPTGKMRFVIDEASLKESLAGSKLSESVFRRIFLSEIGPLLEAVTQGAVERYLQGPSPLAAADNTSPEDRAKRQETLRQRAALVEQGLFKAELRARFRVKVSSTHPRLRRTPSWDVVSKWRSSTNDEDGLDYAYVTLNFETIQPEPEVGFYSWLSFLVPESLGRTESVAFDCDEGDLDDLIKALTDARDALRTRSLI